MRKNTTGGAATANKKVYETFKKTKSKSKLNIVNEKADTKTTTTSQTTKHFLISFHPFSFRIPKSTIFLASLANKEAASYKINNKISKVAIKNTTSAANSIKTTNSEYTNKNETDPNKDIVDMNKRCCLSVSVVPSDKQNGNKNKKLLAKKNVSSQQKNKSLSIFSTKIKHIHRFACSLKYKLNLDKRRLEEKISVL